MKNLIYLVLLFALTTCSEDENGPAAGEGKLDYKPTGSSANDFLSADTYDKLIIEVQYPAGYKPPESAINGLTTFVETYCNKPGGVTINWSEISVDAQSSYTLDDLVAVEKEHRTQFTDQETKTLAAYFFFADADYSENSGNSKILGVAYYNTSMVLFQKTIQDLSGGIGQPSESLITHAVLNHEMGHNLGLVNLGTPMVNDHQDTAHGRHCEVTDCLMYWKAETGDIVDNLIGMSAPPELDSQCQADLQANGGK